MRAKIHLCSFLILTMTIAACPRSPGDPPVDQAGSTSGVDLSEPKLTMTTTVGSSELRRHVAYLASDALQGRGAGTRGLELAADYLERSARELELSPLFGTSFRQPFEMTVGTHLGEGNELEQAPKRTPGSWQRFRVGKDFLPFTFSSTGSTAGRLVFAGYGIRAKEYHYEDYQPTEVVDQIMVVLSGEPGDDDSKSPFDGKRPTKYSALREKVLFAREAGARAILIVRDRLRMPGVGAPEESDSGLIALQVTAGTAKRLLGFDVMALKAKIDGSYQPELKVSEAPEVKVSAAIARDRRTTFNLGALIGPPGSSPSGEAVVIGAHYDHLGLGGSRSLTASDAPVVHNGADDNASGSAAVLEVARALVKRRSELRRRVAFLWFAGEEAGLLGSSAYVKDPAIPLSQTVAMVNLDMVGHLKDKRLSVLGVGSAPELQPLAAHVLKLHGLEGEYTGDAYGPSDHTSFYSRKVPVLYLFTGAHEHYHQPSDDPETLDDRGLAEVTAVAADLVWVLATAKSRPQYVELPAPPAKDGRGYGPYFGLIPDFGENKGGFLLSGVRKDSPAEKAGLAQGDLVIRFNGVNIQSLQDFTSALRGTAPGDEVDVVFVRAGETRHARARLERRASE